MVVGRQCRWDGRQGRVGGVGDAGESGRRRVRAPIRIPTAAGAHRRHHARSWGQAGFRPFCRARRVGRERVHASRRPIARRRSLDPIAPDPAGCAPHLAPAAIIAAKPGHFPPPAAATPPAATTRSRQPPAPTPAPAPDGSAPGAPHPTPHAAPAERARNRPRLSAADASGPEAWTQTRPIRPVALHTSLPAAIIAAKPGHFPPPAAATPPAATTRSRQPPPPTPAPAGCRPRGVEVLRPPPWPPRRGRHQVRARRLLRSVRVV